MFDYPLGDALVGLTSLLALLAVVEAARRARWDSPLAEHVVWALATAVILLAQRMGFTLGAGISLHYLGSAFLVLLVGYPRALLSMALVLLIAPLLQPLAGAAPMASWGLRVLVSALLPIWMMWAIVQLSKRLLARNLFIFLLGCGLFGLFAAYASQLLVAAALYAWLAPAATPAFLDEYLPYAMLLASGEAWLEGMVITVLVVYVPGAVRLFDEAHYLRRP